MWILFNTAGVITKKINNGSGARVSVVGDGFDIIAKFEGIDASNIGNYTATIQVELPDGTLFATPRAMTRSNSELFTTQPNDGDVTPLVDGQTYAVWKWHPEAETDTPYNGTYKATIRLYDAHQNVYVTGRLDFYVEDAVYGGQVYIEPSVYNVLMALITQKEDKYDIHNIRYYTADPTGNELASLDEGQVIIVNVPNTTKYTVKKVKDTTVGETTTRSLESFLSYDYALDNAVVHKTGDETIGGTKTFSNSVNVGSNSVKFANNAAISGDSSVTLKVANEDNKYTFGTNAFTHKQNTTTDLGTSGSGNAFRDAYLSGDVKDDTGLKKYVSMTGNDNISGNKTFSKALKLDNTPASENNEFITKSVTDALGVRIDNITASGRYLAAWNCSAHSIDSLPGGPDVEVTTEVYNYKTGDYYIISAVASGSGINYMPTGTNLPIGTTKTTVPNVAYTGTTQIGVGDAWRYNGSTWSLEINSQKDIPISRVTGLQTALDNKLGKISPELTSMGDTNMSVATKGYVLDHAGGAVNIRDGSGTGALQQIQDGTSGVVDFTNKNPNATTLDPTITGNITYGGTGQYSSALGGKSVAQGKRSHAEGTTTLAKGNYSHVEGDNSVALGNDSHAEGYATVSGGTASHSEGRETVANGFATHAAGVGTYAYHDAQTVVGKYNKKNAGNQLFTVGNGTSDNARNDALEVFDDGTVKFNKLTDGTTTKTVTQLLNNEAVWGNITGTLSNQTDLYNALLEKEDKSNKKSDLTDNDNVTYPTTKAVNDALVGKEDTSNKATDFSVVNNTKYPSVQATKTYVDSQDTITLNSAKQYADEKVVGVYTPKGSVATVPSLASVQSGWVYNMSASFITTDDFIEGAGKTYMAGTNIVCILVNDVKKWDILGASVDTSAFFQKDANGNLDMNNKKVLNVANPVNNGDAVNKQTLDSSLADKADIDGEYPQMTVGLAENLLSQIGETNAKPIGALQSSGGGADVESGNVPLKELSGVSLVWNQLCEDNFGDTITYWTKNRLTQTNSGNVGTFVSNSNAYNYVGIYHQFLENNGIMIKGHKYLMVAQVRITSGACSSITLQNHINQPTTISSPTLNTWYYISNIFEQTLENNQITNGLGISRGYASTSDIIIDSDSMEIKGVRLFDLTLMFGNNDRIPSALLSGITENNQSVSAVACFNRMFRNYPIAYNLGTIISTKPTTYKVVGYNAFDGEIESGYVYNGELAPSTDACRTKNLIKVIPNQKYTIEWDSTWLASADEVAFVEYDCNQNYIKKTSWYTNPYSATLSKDTCFVRVYLYKGGSGIGTNVPTEETAKIAIHLTWSGSKTGYEEYQTKSYNLGGEELKGIYGVSGDTKLPNGNITRKYGIVDLGSLEWTYDSAGSKFFVEYQNIYNLQNASVIPNMICAKYGNATQNVMDTTQDKIISTNYKYIFIRDTNYTDTQTFKTAMSGVYLVYELATETSEVGSEYTEITQIDDYGTQEIVSNTSVAIPSGANIFYQINLQNFLQRTYQRVSGDSNAIAKVSGNASLGATTFTGTNLSDGTTTKSIADILSGGGVNIINASELSSDGTLTDEQVEIFMNNIVYVKGEWLGATNIIFNLNGNNEGIAIISQTSAYGMWHYTVTKLANGKCIVFFSLINKKITIDNNYGINIRCSNDNKTYLVNNSAGIGLIGLNNLNNKSFPSYPTDTTKQYKLVQQVGGTLAWVEDV